MGMRRVRQRLEAVPSAICVTHVVVKCFPGEVKTSRQRLRNIKFLFITPFLC